MASVSPRRTGGPSWPLALVIVIGLMIVVGASLFLYVLIAGQVTIPFTDPPRVIRFGAQEVEKPWEPPPGTVPVPVSGRTIRAYGKITRDDLWNPERGEPSVAWLREEAMSDAIITNARDIMGRVMKHDKSPGYAFTEDDFMPKGTRPGVVGGIPPGMRAMRVTLEDVRGLYGLNPGDRFDVVATIALDGDPADQLKGFRGVYSDRVAMESRLGNLGKQATVKVIVQNGVVVTPVETVMVPTVKSGLMGRGGAGTRPVQEVVVAVRPEEVAPFTEALTVGADLSVVPRSGHPDDDVDSETPSSMPRSPFAKGGEEGANSGGMQLVETIGGKTRELVPVPEIGATPKEK